MFTFGDATVEILRAWRRSKDAVQGDERERDDEQSKSWHRALRRVKERTNERNVKKRARKTARDSQETNAQVGKLEDGWRCFI